MVNAALHSAGCSWGEQLNFRLSSRLSLSVISLSNYTFNFIFIFIVAWQDINSCTNNSYTLQLTVWRLEILSDLNTEKRKADGWSLWKVFIRILLPVSLTISECYWTNISLGWRKIYFTRRKILVRPGYEMNGISFSISWWRRGSF